MATRRGRKAMMGQPQLQPPFEGLSKHEAVAETIAEKEIKGENTKVGTVDQVNGKVSRKKDSHLKGTYGKKPLDNSGEKKPTSGAIAAEATGWK